MASCCTQFLWYHNFVNYIIKLLMLFSIILHLILIVAEYCIKEYALFLTNFPFHSTLVVNVLGFLKISF